MGSGGNGTASPLIFRGKCTAIWFIALEELVNDRVSEYRRFGRLRFLDCGSVRKESKLSGVRSALLCTDPRGFLSKEGLLEIFPYRTGGCVYNFTFTAVFDHSIELSFQSLHVLTRKNCLVVLQGVQRC